LYYTGRILTERLPIFQIGTVAADVAEAAELELNDCPIVWGFSIVIPVQMPAGTTYREAHELFVQLAERVNDAMNRICDEMGDSDGGKVCTAEFELVA